MQDTDWDNLRYFLAVARIGSLSGAAKHLHVNHSTVLRRLGSLENRLRVRLFERVPTGYVMTQAGEALAERLRGIENQIETAQRQLSGLDLRLSGAIRVTSTDTLMHGLLMPYLAEFRQVHQGIQLQLVVNNTFLSLTKREADVAIRPSNKPPDHLIGRRVGRIQTAIYAAKSYIKRNAKRMSDTEPDWTAFNWVAPDEGLAHLAQAKWLRSQVSEEKIAVRVDSLLGMAAAVRQGMGLGLLLCLLAEQERELVRVAGPFEEMDTQVWILTHPDLKSVARIKTLTHFLYERLTGSDSCFGTSALRSRPQAQSRSGANGVRSHPSKVRDRSAPRDCKSRLSITRVTLDPAGSTGARCGPRAAGCATRMALAAKPRTD